jgi:hypothetical protein
MYFFEDACAPPRTSSRPATRPCPEFASAQAPTYNPANWDDLVAINRIITGTAEQVARPVGVIEAAGTNRGT